ncbi:hypothetical protein MHB44_11540 [Lysinibacillus sp. FSL H8-0500]|uniref:hypothetical protein n=1 Tax=Lysinibacillus sp. FSL H8-0500 TaxID=2921393 RepID=UPI003100F378
MEQVAERVKSLVQDNSHEVYSLSAQMVQLQVIQGAVARLLERIDDIVYKGWHTNSGMAHLSILEIRDTVRLVDIGFHPLHTKMQETVNAVESFSNELFDIIVSPDGGKPCINSLIGWNYHAMNNNIDVFKREFGREPESFEEVATYILDTTKKVVAKSEENKKSRCANID